MTRHPKANTVSSVGRNNVPDAIRVRDTLPNPDYVDFCTAEVSGSAERTVEEWARVVLEGTPTGRSAPLLWRLLGLRLGPRSSEYIQGWKIADRGDDWIRLETSSWFMTAHVVFQVGDGRVSLALFLRYDRPIAAVIWAPVSVMHRRAVPVMLGQAVPERLRP